MINFVPTNFITPAGPTCRTLRILHKMFTTRTSVRRSCFKEAERELTVDWRGSYSRLAWSCCCRPEDVDAGVPIPAGGMQEEMRRKDKEVWVFIANLLGT